ncbi:MAG: hypothetical protein U0133_08470 [Gemmatimonadales bacterium]
MQRLVLGMVTALVLVNGRMAAQQQDPRLANATAQAKQKLGLVVFPAKNQAPEQQAQDEQACYAWAQQQVDPLATAPNADSAAKAGRARADSAQQGAALKGAAGGVAGGALIGAVAGDAGDGAKIGAMAGALRGRRAKRASEEQAEQRARAEAAAAGNQQANTFRKAMVACLQGKGYSVQ